MQKLRVFLCGDVMIGRGIDQILLHSNPPDIYESYVRDARDYVSLAENTHGKIQSPVAKEYIWGEALQIWDEFKPDLKIINLETAMTTSNEAAPEKGIHYRVHPLNVDVLTSAKINCCTVANNHVLDWGQKGLLETINTLKNAGILVSGAGETITQAIEPAVFELGSHQRVLIFSAGMESSGIPSEWQATSKYPGVYFLPAMNRETIQNIAENIKRFRQSKDLIIFSLHWGSNWGYEISEAFRSFAHDLIDLAGVDVVFGHSSHHPRPIEHYQGKIILYGCGDFINDYEGIHGHENFRGDLTLMYFLDFDEATLQLKQITLVPMQIKKFSLHRASSDDGKWMQQILNQFNFFAAQFTFENNMLVYRPK